jgi:hypothetical protein
MNRALVAPQIHLHTLTYSIQNLELDGDIMATRYAKQHLAHKQRFEVITICSLIMLLGPILQTRKSCR